MSNYQDPNRDNVNQDFSNIVGPQIDRGVSILVSGLVEKVESPRPNAETPRIVGRLWKQK